MSWDSARRGIAACLACFTLSWPAPALSALEASPSKSSSRSGEGSGPLRATADRILDRAGLDAAFIGVEVRRLRDGRQLYARNAFRHFTPASTTKLLATAAALDAFGPDFRLATTVETVARLDSMGRLLGDVYLVGGGDPELGRGDPEQGKPAALSVLADALKAAGVKRIEGRLVGWEGLFTGDRRGSGWDWEDLSWWYGAEVSALSWNDNCVDLVVSPGEREGDPVVLDRAPISRHYNLQVTATTSASGLESALHLTREPGNFLRLSGSHPLGGEPWKGLVALEDPARYTTSAFADELAARGIQVLGPMATSSEPLPGGRRVLASHQSGPLSEIVAGINKPSHNLHAEMVLRLLGTRDGGKGDPESGHHAVSAFLDRVGVRHSDWSVADGSGLSRGNLLTPRGVVDLLQVMDRHPAAAAFRASLPISGLDGTLKGRMKGGAAEGRVVAKTGTLTAVNALAGYVQTRKGDRLAFAVFVNHHTVPGREAVAAIDDLMALLASQ